MNTSVWVSNRPRNSYVNILKKSFIVLCRLIMGADDQAHMYLLSYQANKYLSKKKVTQKLLEKLLMLDFEFSFLSSC